MQTSDELFVIEMRNRTTLWITGQQALVVDAAWKDRQPVQVNGQMINTVDITGLWTASVWYENHPDDRPQVQNESSVMLLENIEPKNADQKLWLEVLERNRQLLAENKPCEWIVEDHEIKQVNPKYFWAIPPTEKTPYEWVKIPVPPKKANYYAITPGYRFLGEDAGGYRVYAFRRPISNLNPIPHHLDACTQQECLKLDASLEVIQH